MIFSKEKWDSSNEIAPYISVSRAIKFSTMEAPLRNAFEMFLRTLLGDALITDLEAYYAATDATAPQLRLLQLAQRANALLAFWYDYDEMQVIIGDSGAKRQESDSVKTPYKYQEQALKKGWKEKGFAALDDMLTYLESEKTTFTNYKNTSAKTEIVRSAAEVDGYYYISGSRIIFLRLRPHFRNVINTLIAPRMNTIYTDMITSLSSDTPDAKYLKLRETLIPVVVFYAVSRLMRETGSLTDKGLFFETLKNTDDAVNTSLVPDERMTSQATMAEADALAYWKIAEKMLTKDFQYVGSTGSKIPKRDNNDKKAFWA